MVRLGPAWYELAFGTAYIGQILRSELLLYSNSKLHMASQIMSGPTSYDLMLCLFERKEIETIFFSLILSHPDKISTFPIILGYIKLSFGLHYI